MNHRDVLTAEEQESSKGTTITTEAVSVETEASAIGGNLKESLRSPFLMTVFMTKQVSKQFINQSTLKISNTVSR